MGLLRRASLVAVTALVSVTGSPAHAVEFVHPLERGDEGREVRALQVRVAGWFPDGEQVPFEIDGEYGRKTVVAVKAFEGHAGLKIDGVADAKVLEELQTLRDKDGSTKNFDWSEFTQNESSACSNKANSFAGTFKGGPISPVRVRMNVRRLMWRLEALRAKLGGHPIGINSGFRSLAYNQCIGGATASQHLYGTAADLRVADTQNRRTRTVAKRTQFHGIGCYAATTHNHLDTRVDNTDYPSGRFWWWPDRDEEGRDLDEAGRPCWGEKPVDSAQGVVALALRVLHSALMPSPAETTRFSDDGEIRLPYPD